MRRNLVDAASDCQAGTGSAAERLPRRVRVSFEAVIRGADGRAFAVPRIELDGFFDVREARPVIEAVRERHGVSVTLLRCVSSDPDGDDRYRRYELEAHGPVCGLAEVDAEPLPPGHDWEHPAWFETAAAWLRERIDAPVEQVAAWTISTVLRAGDAYLKAVPPYFGAEPAITRALWEREPDRVPEVLDLDVERRWLLMRDFGGEELTVERPVEDWLASIRAYAELQLAWTGHEAELVAAGAPDRRLEQLLRDLDAIFGDVDALLPGREDGLSEEELAAVPALPERLGAAAERLERFEIAPTLDHGDLHAGNVRLRATGPLFYDWSDGCVTMPLLSLVPLVLWHELPFAVTELRDAYLETMGAPVEAFDDAITLGLAHQAGAYYRINAGTPPHGRWQWEDVLPSIVKQLLERA